MFDKEESISRKGDNQAFMMGAMQLQLEWKNVVVGAIRDRMDRQDR